MARFGAETATYRKTSVRRLRRGGEPGWDRTNDLL